MGLYAFAIFLESIIRVYSTSYMIYGKYYGKYYGKIKYQWRLTAFSVPKVHWRKLNHCHTVEISDFGLFFAKYNNK